MTTIQDSTRAITFAETFAKDNGDNTGACGPILEASADDSMYLGLWTGTFANGTFTGTAYAWGVEGVPVKGTYKDGTYTFSEGGTGTYTSEGGRGSFKGQFEAGGQSRGYWSLEPNRVVVGWFVR